MTADTDNTVPLLTPEQLQELNAILATVGLEDPDHWGFQHHVQNRESYGFGLFEWSERGKGMRYYLYADEGQPIREVVVAPLSGATHPVYTRKIVDSANRRLAELFKA